MSDDKIKIVFLGDITLGGEFLSHCEKHNLNHLFPFTLIKPLITDADILFLNLEGPINNGTEMSQGVSLPLSNSPEIINFLSDQKTTRVFNLANNHIMDYGYKGLESTQTLLSSNGIYHLGAGKNSYESNKPLVFECKDRRIAFLAYTINTPYIGAITADPNQPGCASFKDISETTELISELRKHVDIVCVSLHWGYEFFSYPSPEHMNIAHALVEAGAKYVIGHHTHSVQGIESYKGSLIIYSLGNLFLPRLRLLTGRMLRERKEFKEFIIVTSYVLDTKRDEHEVIAGKMDKDYMLVPYTDNQHDKILSLFEDELSKPLHHENYNAFWEPYKSNREKQLLKEDFYSAIAKALHMPLGELLKTMTKDDFKRNMGRLLSFIKNKMGKNV